MTVLLFVAGPSGSGKSRLTRMAGSHLATVSLDDFYRDHDYPGMPQSFGITNWDDAASWDLDLALETLTELVTTGEAELPVYELSISQRTGSRRLKLGSSPLVLAEGIFATDAYRAAKQRGLDCEAIWLERGRIPNFVRRLVRDLKEKRKPPSILLRRGVALYREEPKLRRAAKQAGFTSMRMGPALRRVRELAR